MAETIVYWRGSAEVREDLLKALSESAIAVVQVRTIEDLLGYLEKHDPSAIIVDGSASQREASDRIVEVGNSDLLEFYPIIFVASQARKRVGVLTGREQIYPIDVPYRLHHVLRGILLLLRTPMDVEPGQVIRAMNSAEASGMEIYQSEDVLPILSQTDAAAESLAAALETHTDEIESTELDFNEADVDTAPEQSRKMLRRVEDNSIRNRERLKANPDPARLSSTYGGEVFAIATHSADFDDEKLFPDRANKDLLKKAFEALENQDPWAAVHARRVTFVASAMAHSMSFNKIQEENVRMTCLFINWATNDGESHNSRRHDVLRESSSEVLSEIARAFRASAAMIESRLGDERSARTVELVAKMLEGDKGLTQQQKELVAEAECVLIVELADRSCWSEGHWNPFGVYRVFRNLRGGTAVIASKAVKGAVSRVLGEAVTAHVTVGNVFLSNDDLEAHASAERRARGTTGEKGAQAPPGATGGRRIRSLEVQLSDLLPGMRLAQPVTAMDGRVVLDANVRLDQDIVFQLWQLAAVRALNAKVAIQVEL